MPGATVAPWSAIPDGAVVVPTDDDDWLAPDLARVLAAEWDGGARACHWPSRFVEVPIDLRHRLGLLRRAVRPGTPPKWVCTTNNYAMRKGPDAQRLLWSHVEASRWVAAQPPGAVARVDRSLSVMNRTLASRTSLGHRRPAISRRELLRKHRRYRELYRRPVAPDLAWCEPYLAMMADLMDRLVVRAR